MSQSLQTERDASTQVGELDKTCHIAPGSHCSTDAESLPTPDLDFLKQISTKKSHARKQPPGHIPRPRNAFILFRSCLVHQRKVHDGAQKDHCEISRLAGDLWNKLTPEQKAPWQELALAEKQQHAKLYPGYRYTPSEKQRSSPAEIRQRAEDLQHGADGTISSLVQPFSPPTPFVSSRRSSSCPPPGAPGADLPSTINTNMHDLPRRRSHMPDRIFRLIDPLTHGESYEFPWNYQEMSLPPLTTGPYFMDLCQGPTSWSLGYARLGDSEDNLILGPNNMFKNPFHPASRAEPVDNSPSISPLDTDSRSPQRTELFNAEPYLECCQENSESVNPFSGFNVDRVLGSLFPKLSLDPDRNQFQ